MSKLLVQGLCPTCNKHSLMVDGAGRVVCALLACTDPTAAHRLLMAQPPQLFGETE